MIAARLVSAVVAVTVLVLAVAAGMMRARRLAEEDVHAIAPQMFREKNQGAMLQRAALRQPDLLPLYGSSELNLPSPYHASALFRSYPTGFTIFPVGSAGSTSLIWLQAIAAVGPELRGKRVAISISPRLFMSEMADAHAYGANFSRLHASELVFSSHLSFAVKQAAARRMAAYPATLASDRLLRFAVEQLADGSPASRALYYAAWPLGWLQTLVLRTQDAWDTLGFLNAQSGLRPPARQPADLDWVDLNRRAEADTRQRDEGNALGFDRNFWADHASEIAAQKGAYAKRAVERSVEQSAEWTDLDLLLQAVRELGGEPLLLSLPLKGPYDDFIGVPYAARANYYRQLQDLARSRGVRAVDFSDHDSDASFTSDVGLHLSDRGWVYYDRTLDDFFHGRARGES
jgi:D-alanine transfer protein